MDNQRIFILGGILLSFMIILSSLSLAINRFSYTGRAQIPNSTATFSGANSYLFASPISAPADGKSIIRITVFILNDQGLGVGGLSIKLNISGEVNVNQTQAVTDSFGRAIFDLSARIAGNYTIAAEAQGSALPQSVVIAFR